MGKRPAPAKTSIMKKHYLIHLIAVVVVILLLVDRCGLQQRIDSLKDTVELKDEDLQKEVSRYRDTLGRERVKYAVTQLTIEQLQTSTSTELAEIKEELRRQGLKIKNTHSTTIVETRTTDTIHIPVNDTLYFDTSRVDTFTQFAFNWSDDWLDLSGKTNFRRAGKNWVLAGIDLGYKLDNKILVNYTFSKKPLKPRELFLTVMNQNPNTTVNRVQTYTIKYESKWFEKWWLHQLIGATWGATAMYFIKN